MSRLVAKIMLALLMLPLGGLVYLVTIVIMMETFFRSWRSASSAFLLTSAVTWMFVAGYWTLLWRKAVRWAPWRIVATLASAVLVLLPATVGGVIVAAVEDELGAFIGGLTAILLWLTTTVFIWRETRQERTQRLRGTSRALVVCPACGYNLTGLREPSCPECGATYTLDELLSGQPQQEHSDLG